MLPSKMRMFLHRTLPDGVQLRLQAMDHYVNGERELKILKYLCSKNKVSLDIGSNIGIYAYFMGFYSSSVIAYEPNPHLAGRLHKVLPHITVRPVAVSDRAGQLPLLVPVQNGRVMHELGSIAQSFEGHGNMETYPVDVVKIDEENIGDVGLIKVDVEQNEIPVLLGAMETIRRSRPCIIVEVTPLLYEHDLPNTFEFILEEDFQGWFFYNRNYVPFSCFVQDVHANKELFGTERFMGGNVIFIPREFKNRKLFERVLRA